MMSPDDFLDRIHRRDATTDVAGSRHRVRTPSARNHVFSPRWYDSPTPPKKTQTQRLLLTDGPVQTTTKFAKKRRLRSASCFLNVWTKPWTLWGRRRGTSKKGVARKA
jgi:hypothetical protein